MEEISSQSGVSSPNLKEQITRQVLQYVLYGKNPVQMVNTHETNIKSKLVNDESSQQDQRSKTVTKLMENSDPNATTETDNTHAQSEKASINLSYAIASFPNEVSLCVSSIPGTVFGVCAKQHIPVGTWIGPYEGKRVCPDDVTVDMNTSHMWEIYEKGKLAYFLDGSDKNTSSWMRFIRCARHKQEQNLLAFQHNKDVFYRAFRDIPRGCELLVWYEDSYIKHMGIPFGIADRSSPLHFTERLSRVKHPVAIRAASLVSGSVREEQEHDVDSGFKPCRVQKRRSSLHSSLVEEVSDEPKRVAIQRLNKRFKDQQESDSDSLIHNEANVRPSLDRADNGRKLNTRKNELTRHRKLFDEVIDTSGENGEFKCGQCKIIFTQRSLLNSHLCSRMPCKPYRCGHCQEAFAQPKELRMHSVVHVSEKPFKCGYCLRAFSGATTLNNHVRTHTGEKPFLCERCGKSFSQAFQLSRHRRVCTQNGE